VALRACETADCSCVLPVWKWALDVAAAILRIYSFVLYEGVGDESNWEVKWWNFCFDASS